MKIIGLCGHAGAGKDTVREILCNARGMAGAAFADPLRAMGEALLVEAGVPLAYARDRSLKEVEMPVLLVSWRRLLQTLGTEWGRGLRDTFWLDIMAGRVASIIDEGLPGLVISDVRFPNEARWLLDAGGELWRVDRPGVAPVAVHVSEQHVMSLPADRVIRNDGTLAQLQAQVLA
jgi:hypothetical protein